MSDDHMMLPMPADTPRGVQISVVGYKLAVAIGDAIRQDPEMAGLTILHAEHGSVDVRKHLFQLSELLNGDMDAALGVANVFTMLFEKQVERERRAKEEHYE